MGKISKAYLSEPNKFEETNLIGRVAPFIYNFSPSRMPEMSAITKAVREICLLN